MVLSFMLVDDHVFHRWQGDFVNYTLDIAEDCGLVTTRATNQNVKHQVFVDDLVNVLRARCDWDEAYYRHLESLKADPALASLKNEARKEYESYLRELVEKVMIDCPDKALGGFFIGGKRQAESAPPCAPVTRPEVTIYCETEKHMHIVRFHDETMPGQRTKPAGVAGCEIWRLHGDSDRVGDESCREVMALAQETPHLIMYTPEMSGTTVHYALRWVTSHGEYGPWSDVLSAPV